ncbi:hypothetical protein MJO28_006364 [Puccinia striiformis f. sp. tritici]|uniref:Uncharacterized protein n=1 Tax=Puccinia striiformis f. sp. tritici TaxID=168172 RepID=A0ACC0EIG6_9BASI|nr:hypothetical protein MJO28_006364 [Puccinia striiformis f. sp. tritici]
MFFVHVTSNNQFQRQMDSLQMVLCTEKFHASITVSPLGTHGIFCDPEKPVENRQWREEITHSDVPRFWFTIDHIVKARKFLSTMVTCENSCIRLEIM